MNGKYKILGMRFKDNANDYVVIESSLNNNSVYKSEYYVEYTIQQFDEYNKLGSICDSYDHTVNIGEYYYLPKFDKGYAIVEVIDISGNTHRGTISQVSDIDVSSIDRIKIWYPELTSNITFRGIKIKELLHIKTDSLTSMRYMFYNCDKLVSVNVSDWNTENVTDMDSMFRDCKLLTSLDLTNFNTSKVTDMSWIFSGCSSLSDINLSTWDTSRVVIENHMYIFNGTPFNKYFHHDPHDPNSYSKWTITEEEADYSYIFPWNNKYFIEYTIDSLAFPDDTLGTEVPNDSRDLRYLPKIYNEDENGFKSSFLISDYHVDVILKDGSVKKSLDVKVSDIEKVRIYYYENTVNIRFGSIISVNDDVSNIYNRVEGIEYINAENLTSMNGMFAYCRSLRKIENLWSTSKLTDMNCMFYESELLGIETLDLSGIDTSQVGGMQKVFYGCSYVRKMKLGWSTSNVTDMGHMFDGCTLLESVDNIADWDTYNVRSMSNMFNRCLNMVPDVSAWDVRNVTNMGWMFRHCGIANPEIGEVIPELDLSAWDVRNVTHMDSMFEGCYMENINLSNWNLNNVNASSAFSLTNHIKTLNLSNWSGNILNDGTSIFFKSSLTSLDLTNANISIDNPSRMFYECKSLTSINLTNANITVTGDMTTMFLDCKSLTSLDLSGFNTTNATSSVNMFKGCSSLTSLNLSNWDTANITSMLGMFENCSSLTSLDLTSFNTTSVSNMSSMFENCSSLLSLDLTSFNTLLYFSASFAAVTDMFKGMPSNAVITIDDDIWSTEMTEEETSFSGTFTII